MGYRFIIFSKIWPEVQATLNCNPKNIETYAYRP